jgi:hypothetical protein
MFDIKERLKGYKKIKILGMKFIIRKINPLLDFPADKIPQIFTSFETRRKVVETTPSITDTQKSLRDTYAIIEAGVVEPKLEKYIDGKEEGITAEDLFRDFDIGFKLYIEIITHSMNRFRGLKGLFFSIKTKQLLSTEWRKNMESLRTK